MKTTPTSTLQVQLFIAILRHLWILLLFCGVSVHAVEPESRITIAVLPLEDQTKDKNEAHWRHSLSRMITQPMAPVKQVRIYMADAMEYGLRRCNIQAGSPIQAEQAKTIGEIIEARRVVWGHYRREGKSWTVTVQVMVVADGKTSAPISATSDNWFTLTQQLAEKILTELKVSPTAEEKQKMQRRPTESSEALEYYSRCYQMQTDRKPFEEIAQMAQKAIKADPGFSAAYSAYGVCLLSQGKIAEGRVQFEKALELKPDDDRALLALGVLCGMDNNFTEAAKFLRSAVQHGPDDTENYVRLAEFYILSNEYQSAVAQLEIALKLNPVSSSAKAQLGLCCSYMAKKELAVRAMQSAVLIEPDNAGIYQVVSQGYFRLGMTSQAIESLEKMIASGREIGLNPEVIGMHEKRLQQLRSSLQVAYVTAAEPRHYSEEELTKELRERLTPEEFSQLIYPMKCAPAMKSWAQELTKNSKDDTQKARALYEALAQHLSPAGGGALSAEQVFQEWNTPDSSFQCQEYARLYVALAREVGLHAYFTRVDRDHEDKNILHACAAVFLSGKVILVDVSYRWFGIPHKKFTINNDYEAMVMQMNQSEGLACKRIAVKLQPDDLSLFNLAGHLMGNDQNEEAKSVIERFLRIDSEEWMKHYALGALAWMDHNWDLAEKELRQSIQLHSQQSSSHYHLGLVLLEKRNLPDALVAFRDCIQQRPSEEIEIKCRRLIAIIHENLSDSDPNPGLAALAKWRASLTYETYTEFLFFEWTPAIYIEVGLINDERPESLGIKIEALRKQAAKEPDNATCRYLLGYLYGLNKQHQEADAAMKDAQRIARSLIKTRPNDLEASYVLVRCLRGNEEASTVAKKLVEQHPQEWLAWMCLSTCQSEAFKRELFKGLDDLPAHGYDLARAQEAMELRSDSIAECLKLSKMVDECFANAQKAVDLSKDSTEALLHLIGLRSYLTGFRAALQRIANLDVEEMMTSYRINLDLLARAVQSAQDQPEVLAAISLIQSQLIFNVESRERKEVDVAAVQKKIQAVVAPTMKRLLDLSEHKDKSIAAVAYEGYCCILMSRKGAGMSVEIPANIAERLDQFLLSSPERYMLWDLRIVHDAVKATDRAQIKICHELALKRIKLFPTARGYAMLAATSQSQKEELSNWEKATTMEPEHLLYALNHVAASMRVDSSETGLADALKRLQDLGDKGYENGYWQNYPQYNLYRMRLFIIQQALAGKMDAASRALDQVLKASDSDAHLLKLADLLKNKPE